MQTGLSENKDEQRPGPATNVLQWLCYVSELSPLLPVLACLPARQYLSPEKTLARHSSPTLNYLTSKL